MKNIQITEGNNKVSRITITDTDIRVKISEEDIIYKNEIIEYTKQIANSLKDLNTTFRAIVKQDNGIFFIHKVTSHKQSKELWQQVEL